jgi:hypothetical protein
MDSKGHELPGKWKVAKEMIGRRLSQAEAKRLLAKFAWSPFAWKSNKADNVYPTYQVSIRF